MRCDNTNRLTAAARAIWPITDGGMCSARGAPVITSGTALCAMNTSASLATGSVPVPPTIQNKTLERFFETAYLELGLSVGP